MIQKQLFRRKKILNLKVTGINYVCTNDGNIYNLIGDFKNDAELTKLTKLNNKMIISQIKENCKFIHY